MQVEEFKFDRDLLSVNTWQYDQADEYLALLQAKEDWYKQYFRTFWGDWYEQVFRLEIDYDPNNPLHVHTNLFGCVIWALILDFPLEPILTPRDGSQQPWAFENIGTPIAKGVSRENFGNAEDPSIDIQGGNFTPASSSVALTLLEKVQLLKLVYYRNIGNVSVPFLNKALADVFRITGLLKPTPITQTPYVLDHRDMTMEYVFPYELSDPMKIALVQWDVLPKPMCVNVYITYM